MATQERTWLTIAEVAEMSGLSELTVRRHIYRNILVAWQPGGKSNEKYRIELDEFDRWYSHYAKPEQMKGWKTILQIVEETGMSESTVRRNIYSGSLLAEQLVEGGTFRIEEKNFQKWMKRRNS